MKIRKRITSAILTSAVTASFVFSLTANAAYAYPDADGNGSVGINDSVVIRMYLAGYNEPTDLTALDFDENGVISEMDAQTVQLYLSGLWRNENDN